MDRFAEVCERIAGHTGTARKLQLIEEYLATLSEEDHGIAEQLLVSRRKASISGASIREAVIAVTGYDAEVVRACREAAGDTAEMAALLVTGFSRGEPLPLTAAAALLDEFARAAKPATKTAILREVLGAYRGLTLKYLLRVLLGNLKLGLTVKTSPPKPALPGEHRLLAVITSAEQGRGKMAMSLSEYTLGVRSADGFVNVGKAPGANEREIRQLTRVLRRITVERFGRVALVKPEIVVEVAFAGLQKSRHKGGYSLIHPHVLGWKPDKTPQDCDSLDRLVAQFESTPEPVAESPSLLF